MTIYDLEQEWGGLTDERKRKAFHKLIDIYFNDPENFSAELLEILESASYVEADDGFGTEGADV